MKFGVRQLVATLAGVVTIAAVPLTTLVGGHPRAAASGDRTVVVNVVDRRTRAVFVETLNVGTGKRRRISGRVGDPEGRGRRSDQPEVTELVDVVGGPAPYAVGYVDSGLWAMPLDGGAHRPIISADESISAPVLLSRDGKVILYSSGDREVTVKAGSASAVIAADSVGLSPDGSLIAGSDASTLTTWSSGGKQQRAYAMRCDDAVIPVAASLDAICFDQTRAGGSLVLVNLGDGRTTPIAEGTAADAVEQFSAVLAPSGRRGTYVRDGGVYLWSLDPATRRVTTRRVEIPPFLTRRDAQAWLSANSDKLRVGTACAVKPCGNIDSLRLQSLRASRSSEVALGILDDAWIAELDFNTGKVGRLVARGGAASVLAVP